MASNIHCTATDASGRLSLLSASNLLSDPRFIGNPGNYPAKDRIAAMDQIEITHVIYTPRRHSSLSEMLTILERGLTSIRTEMNLGMQVDEQLVSELEIRVARLRQMATTGLTHPSNRL